MERFGREEDVSSEGHSLEIDELAAGSGPTGTGGGTQVMRALSKTRGGWKRAVSFSPARKSSDLPVVVGAAKELCRCGMGAEKGTELVWVLLLPAHPALGPTVSIIPHPCPPRLSS